MGKGGPSFIKRGGPELGTECLMLICLNQQVLTEVAGGGKYKEPAFPNRNLLKVASDQEGACQSEKSKTEGVCMGASSAGHRQPPVRPGLTLAGRTR